MTRIAIALLLLTSVAGCDDHEDDGACHTQCDPAKSVACDGECMPLGTECTEGWGDACYSMVHTDGPTEEEHSECERQCFIDNNECHDPCASLYGDGYQECITRCSGQFHLCLAECDE